MLDGHDLRNFSLKWLRQQMGLVNQEPVLFGATIAENILCGKEGANIQQLEEAAKAANAHSFIQSLPNGYHTQVTIFLYLFHYDTNYSCFVSVTVSNRKIHIFISCRLFSSYMKCVLQ